MLSLIESTLSSIQNLIIGMVTMMNNPWQPADIWFPVVWLLTHKAILKSIHKVWRVLKCNIIRSCEPYMDDSFKDSFLGSLCQPMTSLGWVFILLYLYDNIVLTMRGMGMAIPLDSTIINGFDGAVYSAWLATTVLQLKDRWFASIQYSAGITHGERGLGFLTNDAATPAQPVYREHLLW
ncbi:unnamed protein product [Pedinophyceae sp. YPF-701]|nr:unnamed protein product [Pedinophyceae sp. YPF-701]